MVSERELRELQRDPVAWWLYQFAQANGVSRRTALGMLLHLQTVAPPGALALVGIERTRPQGKGASA